MANSFEMIAKTFQGLEEVLAKELQELGAEQVEIITRGVRFYGDQELMYRANFKCRTALRILKPFYKFQANDTDQVYDIIKAYDWSQYLDSKKTFAVDAVVYSENFKHSKFLAYRVKDAIADRFMEKCGQRPSVRITNPDIQLNIHVSGEDCTLSLDSSGEPLYMRGYKVEQTEAPLNEVLAAGMLKLAGWDGQTDFMDPMCGSATIAIEAALMALNIAPGLYRKGFAFEKWPDFNQDILDALYEDESEEREFNHKIYASDISSAALRVAEENVKSAGMSKYIELSHKPFQGVDRPEQETMIMFNPPYGERLKVACDLFEEIGSKLKKDFTDMSAWVIVEPSEASDHIGLRPSVKYHLLNGSIPCEFRKYDMFKGRRDDFLKEREDKKEEQSAEEKAKQESENPSFNDRNGVFLRPVESRWHRESQEEGELSEYERNRHERFARKFEYEEKKKEREAAAAERRARREREGDEEGTERRPRRERRDSDDRHSDDRRDRGERRPRRREDREDGGERRPRRREDGRREDERGGERRSFRRDDRRDDKRDDRHDFERRPRRREEGEGKPFHRDRDSRRDSDRRGFKDGDRRSDRGDRKGSDRGSDRKPRRRED